MPYSPVIMELLSTQIYCKAIKKRNSYQIKSSLKEANEMSWLLSKVYNLNNNNFAIFKW